VLEIYPENDASPSEISRAEAFLLDLFSTTREIPSKSVYDMAEAEGINTDTIKKAKLKIPGLDSKLINRRWHHVYYRGGRNVSPLSPLNSEQSELPL
jgi:hypothetical protein